MRDVSYAVDIWWVSGNSVRTEVGLKFKAATSYMKTLRANSAVNRIELVKVVTTERTVRQWQRKQP